MLLTAKGYPDVATRAFLHLLTTATSRNGFHNPLAYCLVDYDPDGLAIFLTYRDGSLALHHERKHLVAPTLECIGLGSESIHSFIEMNDEEGEDGLLRLTSRDRRKAIRMLERQDDWGCSSADASAELRMMLMLNVKCEIQVLDDMPSGLGGWLADRMNIVS